MTAPPLAPPDLKRYRASTTLTMRATQDTELPAGVCGQVEGIAMVYGVIDSWGTTWLKGCLDRTVRERVAARKVKLYFDHGDVPVNGGMYDTHLHIGTVVEMWDATTDDGLECSRFRADIFDTEPGRTAHEYLTAVAQTRSETGVSVGLLTEPTLTRAVIAGHACDQITEAALREISVTGESSVPGTKVTHVRVDMPTTPSGASVIIGGPITDAPIDYNALLDGLIAHIGADQVRARLSATVSNAVQTDSDAGLTPDSNAVTTDSPGVSQGGTEPPLPNVAPEERLAFVRSQFQRLHP